MAVKKKKKIIKKRPASKKKILKKKPVSRKKPVIKKKAPAKKKATPKKKPIVKAPAEIPIGKITHYFPHVQAGVIKVIKGPLEVGQTIKIKGHTTDFTQTIDSMQIDHVPVTKAEKGAEIGLKVASKVRHGDLVFKA
ncbi:MAG: hypothetical protein Q8N14_04150 [Candidatus Omnitrophota bacterium]|nr:hypothetical protein [Candidatus Omnitrophota bacterium]